MLSYFASIDIINKQKMQNKNKRRYMLVEPTSKKELSLIYSLLRLNEDDSLASEQKERLRIDANSKLVNQFGISVDRYHASVRFSPDSIDAIHKAQFGNKVYLDYSSAEDAVCKMIEAEFSKQNVSDNEKNTFHVEPSIKMISGNVVVVLDFPESDSISKNVVRALSAVDSHVSDLTGGDSGMTIQTHGLDNKISTFSNLISSNQLGFDRRRTPIEFNDSASSKAATRTFVFSSATASEASASIFIEKHKDGFESVYQNYKGKLDKTPREASYVM